MMRRYEFQVMDREGDYYSEVLSIGDNSIDAVTLMRDIMKDVTTTDGIVITSFRVESTGATNEFDYVLHYEENGVAKLAEYCGTDAGYIDYSEGQWRYYSVYSY